MSFTSSFYNGFLAAENDYLYELEADVEDIWRIPAHCITSFRKARSAFSAAPKIQLLRYLQTRNCSPIPAEELENLDSSDYCLQREQVDSIITVLKQRVRGKDIKNYRKASADGAVIRSYNSWTNLFRDILTNNGRDQFFLGSSLYLDKSTVKIIGYALNFSFDELADFLLRATEDGISLTDSSDFIDAYCFAAHHGFERAQELKESYAEYRNTADPVGNIDQNAIGFTNDAWDTFHQLSERLDNNTDIDGCDQIFINWMQEHCLFFDRPSKTAHFVLYNLLRKLIADSKKAFENKLPIFESEQKYAGSILSSALDDSCIQENDNHHRFIILTGEDLDNYSLSDEDIAIIIASLRESVSQYYYGYPYPADEDWLKTIPYFNRISALLKNEKEVTKNDLLLLLCYIFSLAQVEEKDNLGKKQEHWSHLEERAKQFIYIAGEILDVCHLPSFYWAHPLELAAILSILTETPIEEWNPEPAESADATYSTKAATKLWVIVRNSVNDREFDVNYREFGSWILADSVISELSARVCAFFEKHPDGAVWFDSNANVAKGEIPTADKNAKFEIVFKFPVDEYWPTGLKGIRSKAGISLYDYSKQLVYRKNFLSPGKEFDGDPEGAAELESAKIGYIPMADPDLPKIIDRTVVLLVCRAIADQVKVPDEYKVRLDIKPSQQTLKIKGKKAKE